MSTAKDTRQSYPARVMLAGEYGLLVGGSALTIPLNRFSALVRDRSDVPEGKEHEVSRSTKYMKSLSPYIRQLPAGSFHAKPDLKRLADEIDKVWLDSDIPTGAGLGSSGAASAALYDHFFPAARTLSLKQQKEDLAAIESCFHSKSSGVDPLTCFTGTPLMFSIDGSVRQVDFDPAKIPGGYRFFLLDSGNRLESAPLVQHFLKQVKDPHYAASIRNEYLVINQKLIETLLGERDADPGMLVRVLSDFQYTHFRRMIPPDMLDLWIEGQITGEYLLKLNGSGGGLVLGITHSTNMESLEERWKAHLTWIG